MASNQVQQRQRKVLKGGFDYEVIASDSRSAGRGDSDALCLDLLGLAGSLVGLMALVMFISGSMRNAILLLILAYLISPLGLPMATAWLLARVQDLRYAIMEAVAHFN